MHVLWKVVVTASFNLWTYPKTKSNCIFHTNDECVGICIKRPLDAKSNQKHGQYCASICIRRPPKDKHFKYNFPQTNWSYADLHSIFLNVCRPILHVVAFYDLPKLLFLVQHSWITCALHYFHEFSSSTLWTCTSFFSVSNDHTTPILW